MPDQLLTHSRWSCAKRCLREHFYRYELGVVKDRENDAPRIGRIFHLGRELLDSGWTLEKVMRAIRGIYQNNIPNWVKEEADFFSWHIEKEVCVRLVEGHFNRWGDESSETIAPEHAFEIPIFNPETGGRTSNFRLAGRIDAICKLSDGRVALKERKTTGVDISPEADYWARLRLDSQISLYTHAAKFEGYDVETIIYDVTRRPSIRPHASVPEVDEDGIRIVVDLSTGERVKNSRTGEWRVSEDKTKGYVFASHPETVEEFSERLRCDIASRPEFYYQRQEIPRLECDLDEFRFELWQGQQLLRECQRTGRWFRNTASCLSPFKCEYFSICTSGADPSVVIPEGYKKLETVHPELEEKNDAELYAAEDAAV